MSILTPEQRQQVEKEGVIPIEDGAFVVLRADLYEQKILDVIAPIAQAHGCSAARVALAWLLAKPVVTSIIIGAKRLEQLADNLAAVELKLTEDEITQLDQVSALPPEYPGWMLPFQGADRQDPAKSRFGRSST
jgi:diketogulonate reductase-like aldo/keto reductase